MGEAILKQKEYAPGPLCGTDDTATLDRAHSILNSYFQLLASANSAQWESGRKGYLCTNVALQAYLMLLSEIIGYMESNKGLTARELEPNELIAEIEEYMDPILSWLGEASTIQMEKQFKVQFGSGGPPEYFFRLCQMIRESFSDFSPEGMDEWAEEQSEELVADADKKLKDLNIVVQKAIFDTFKQKYGKKGDAYWNRGVIDKKIMMRAYEKSLDDDDEHRLPLENYLDFIEYKKIVENRAHWMLFKPLFDILEPGEKGYSKNVRWMERINELRRIPAHATEKRHYKTSDFDYINYIFEEFMNRLESVNISAIAQDGS